MRDIDIRVKIKSTHLKKYIADSQSKVVEEFCVSVGEARMDIAVINGSLHGYEIKSDSDTLYRLPSQIETYSKTFDYLTIVTGKKHLENVIESVPEWCGVIVASNNKTVKGITLKTVRKPKINLQVDNLSLAQLLWKEETIEILVSLGIKKGLSGKPKPFLWKLLADSISTKELSIYVRETLKLRSNWKADQ
jgi:hypothetical protein